MKYVLIAFLVWGPLVAMMHPTGITRHDRDDDAYTQLAGQPPFEPVAMVRSGSQFAGSAVLVSASWLVTAKHVVESFRAPSLSVELLGRQHAVESVVRHRSADLALLKLSAPVQEVKPATRYRGDRELGLQGVSVGYGVAGRGDETMGAILERGTETVGTKRAGANEIDEMEGALILLADFDHPSDTLYNMMGSAQPLDLEYLPMAGDSGGGLFIEDEGTWALAGVTISARTPRRRTVDSGMFSETLAYGWISQWHRISSFNQWVDEHIDAVAR
ncbi:MAG: trypsin-like serine protease [Bacteroidota bacterium]